MTTDNMPPEADYTSQLYPNRSASSGGLSNYNPAEQYSEPVHYPRSHKRLALFILLLAMGLYVVFLYTKDFGPFGVPPFSNDQIMSGIVSSGSRVNSANYKVDIKIDIEPRENNVEYFRPAVPSGEKYKGSTLLSLFNLLGSMGSIPPDLKFDATISGQVQKTGDRIKSSHMNIGANAYIGETKINIDTAFNRVGENDFVAVNKLITLSRNDAVLRSGSYLGSLFDQDDINRVLAEESNQIKSALLLASNANLFSSTNQPVKEYINWNTFYRYELSLDKDKLIKFYSDLLAESNSKYKDSRSLFVDQATLDYLGTPEFGQVFEYLKKNSSLILWADPSGIPARVQYSLKLAPRGSEFQIKTVVTIALSGINKSVTDFSTNSIIAQNQAITGQSKEQYQFDRQLSAISTIRKALANYKNVTNSYPNSLDELTKKQSIYGFSSSFLDVVPTDVYTNSQFAYENKGKDYVLTYNIVIPPYKPGDSARKMFTFNYISGSLTIVARAVDGINTATASRESEEAHNQSLKDTDGDKVPDIIEKYLGTSITSRDTDRDGRSDYVEITADSNPLGLGTLKYNGGFWF